VSRAGWIRLGAIGALVAAVEALCRAGIVSPLRLLPPSAMVLGLGPLLTSATMLAQVARTLADVGIALALAVMVGFVVGAVLSALPRVRAVVEPLLVSYYAVPVFVFYPFFIVVLGLNRYPRIAIGFLLAVVAMIVSTLNGFDRVPPVLLKTARVLRLSRVETVRRVILPHAVLYVSTGLKLAVAYAFIGVIAAEFIMSGDGIGYEIAFAFNNFDNRTLYPLILLVLLVSSSLTLALHAWERRYVARQTTQEAR
jgi:NitT/TauT family transport system permease protein